MSLPGAYKWVSLFHLWQWARNMHLCTKAFCDGPKSRQTFCDDWGNPRSCGTRTLYNWVSSALLFSLPSMPPGPFQLLGNSQYSHQHMSHCMVKHVNDVKWEWCQAISLPRALFLNQWYLHHWCYLRLWLPILTGWSLAARSETHWDKKR